MKSESHEENLFEDTDNNNKIKEHESKPIVKLLEAEESSKPVSTMSMENDPVGKPQEGMDIERIVEIEEQKEHLLVPPIKERFTGGLIETKATIIDDDDISYKSSEVAHSPSERIVKENIPVVQPEGKGTCQIRPARDQSSNIVSLDPKIFENMSEKRRRGKIERLHKGWEDFLTDPSRKRDFEDMMICVARSAGWSVEQAMRNLKDNIASLDDKLIKFVQGNNKRMCQEIDKASKAVNLFESETKLEEK